MEKIQQRRITIWNNYYSGLKALEDEGYIRLPFIPGYATNNAHMFYIVCNDSNHRDGLIEHLKARQILSVFHYLSLHRSPFYKNKYSGESLGRSDLYSDTLVRLPLYFELTGEQQKGIISEIVSYFVPN